MRMPSYATETNFSSQVLEVMKFTIQTHWNFSTASQLQVRQSTSPSMAMRLQPSTTPHVLATDMQQLMLNWICLMQVLTLQQQLQGRQSISQASHLTMVRTQLPSTVRTSMFAAVQMDWHATTRMVLRNGHGRLLLQLQPKSHRDMLME